MKGAPGKDYALTEAELIKLGLLEMKGEKGRIGPMGPKGDKGDTGEKGSKGDVGKIQPKAPNFAEGYLRIEISGIISV